MSVEWTRRIFDAEGVNDWVNDEINIHVYQGGPHPIGHNE